jgi:hypothetical protein
MPVNMGAVRGARRNLGTLVSTLDKRTSKCGACGLTKYENRYEQQMSVEVEAMIRKLDRWLADNAAKNPNKKENA